MTRAERLWHKEAADAPSLDVLKAGLDGELSSEGHLFSKAQP